MSDQQAESVHRHVEGEPDTMAHRSVWGSESTVHPLTLIAAIHSARSSAESLRHSRRTAGLVHAVASVAAVQSVETTVRRTAVEKKCIASNLRKQQGQDRAVQEHQNKHILLYATLATLLRQCDGAQENGRLGS